MTCWQAMYYIYVFCPYNRWECAWPVGICGLHLLLVLISFNHGTSPDTEVLQSQQSQISKKF